jgi:hypothetical protein
MGSAILSASPNLCMVCSVSTCNIFLGCEIFGMLVVVVHRYTFRAVGRVARLSTDSGPGKRHGGHLVQPLNYATHAIEQLSSDRQRAILTNPELGALYDTVIELLSESIKFILPNCAELIDMSELRQAHVDMARLPYPVVAFEATWGLPQGPPSNTLTGERSTRRIALCMTLTAELALRVPGAEAFLDEAGGGVLVIPIGWNDAHGCWKMPLGGVFVPHQNEVADYVPGETCLLTRMTSERIVDAGVPVNQLKTLRVLPFNLIPSVVRAGAGYSEERIAAMVIGDARDEIAMLLQACVVLNCSNVQAATLTAPVALNRKRVAKGKQPFFDYRVLQVGAPRGRSDQVTGRHHASPLSHLRRGHIRRLEGKTVWVRPTVVNPGGEAATPKAYAVRTPASGLR